MKQKMTRTSATVTLAAVVFVGCAGPEGRVKTAIYDTANRAATTRLDVFQVGEKPARPYHIIALLTADGPAREEGECTQGMLIRARKMGADGLIILEPEAPNKSIVFKYGWIGPSPDDRVFKGSAVIYDK